MNKEIYLDNAATTKVDENVMKKVNEICMIHYGNPGSLHRKGFVAEGFMSQAAQIIANHINCDKEEVFFTSGATESNNLAIRGVLNANRRSGKHIITTKLEHSSVKNIYKYLENEYEVTYLDVDNRGYIDMQQLQNSIREDTVLVSIMFVNNEIGTIQNVEMIGKIIKSRNPNTYFHVDAVQAYGKLLINVKKFRIDMLSMSGHKMHALKGIGALYVKKSVKIAPIVLGGGQQRGLRSGTDNTPGIVSMGEATKIAYANLQENVMKMKTFKIKLVEAIMSRIKNVRVNGPSVEEGAPHILNLYIKGIRGEILLHALSDKGIYISTGSACSQKRATLSPVLKAIGCSIEEIEGTVRISFSKYVDINDIPYIVDTMAKCVSEIRQTILS